MRTFYDGADSYRTGGEISPGVESPYLTVHYKLYRVAECESALDGVDMVNYLHQLPDLDTFANEAECPVYTSHIPFENSRKPL